MTLHCRNLTPALTGIHKEYFCLARGVLPNDGRSKNGGGHTNWLRLGPVAGMLGKAKSVPEVERGKPLKGQTFDETAKPIRIFMHQETAIEIWLEIKFLALIRRTIHILRATVLMRWINAY